MLAAPAAAQAGSAVAAPDRPDGAAQAADGGAAAALHDLFAREWEVRMRENPLYATSVGRHEYDDRLPDVTPETLAREADEAQGFLDELATIDRDALGTQDRVSYDIFASQLRDGIKSYQFGSWQIPINADSGFHIGFSRLPEEVPFQTTRTTRTTSPGCAPTRATRPSRSPTCAPASSAA